MHICWGNYEGPHTFDIGLEKILPIILKANLKYLLIESSNPRHAHEWKVFEKIKLPQDKVIVPGVIDSTSNFVEHPEVVADRLKQFSTFVQRIKLWLEQIVVLVLLLDLEKLMKKFVMRN